MKNSAICKIIMVSCLLLGGAVHGADEAEPREVKHRVTGLFSQERVADLEALVSMIPEIELKGVDFDRAEITVVYDRATVFPNANEEQVIQRFDQLVGNLTRRTFGIVPLSTTSREKLQLVEIPVAGLDCKACCLAAYEAIYKLNGVDQATASFKLGRVTAWIQADVTNAETLEAALEQRGVTLVP